MVGLIGDFVFFVLVVLTTSATAVLFFDSASIIMVSKSSVDAEIFSSHASSSASCGAVYGIIFVCFLLPCVDSISFTSASSDAAVTFEGVSFLIDAVVSFALRIYPSSSLIVECSDHSMFVPHVPSELSNPSLLTYR